MKTEFPPPAPRELVLIVDPKAGIRVRNGEVFSIAPDGGPGAEALAQLITSEQVIIHPLYGVSEESLLERTSSTKKMMGAGQRLDLSIFYKITAPDERLKSLVSKFRELNVVQAAYIKPGVELTIMDNSIGNREGLKSVTSVGDLTAQQVYLNSVLEGGFGVPCAWALEGGRGTGVHIIDAEGAWRFSHEDLPVNQGGLIGGTERNEIGWRNHGTAVFGVLGGDNNTFGITGMCPEAYVSAVSVFGTPSGAPAPDWSAAAAIRCAADALGEGDILLIEHHLPGRRADYQTRNDQYGYIPIEWWPCNLAAIQYAVDRGVIVIAAAGNGQQNLDDPIYDDDPEVPHGPFPDWWRNPFPRDPIDSGAILVGAGHPPRLVFGGSVEVDRSRLPESNFGSVVDAQGWGDNVVTCGYGGLSPGEHDENRWYTSRFNGTSSAAAMVAGVVGCLQGILRARGITLDPLTLRGLLRDDLLNSQQQEPIGVASAVRIGPRPNLCNLIDHLIPPPLPPGIVERILNLLRALLGRNA